MPAVQLMPVLTHIVSRIRGRPIGISSGDPNSEIFGISAAQVGSRVSIIQDDGSSWRVRVRERGNEEGAGEDENQERRSQTRETNCHGTMVAPDP